jgi:hypothetical protein
VDTQKFSVKLLIIKEIYMQRLTRYSLRLFTFTLLSVGIFTVFGGTEYAQADSSNRDGFTERSLKGTYAIGVRNILPNAEDNQSIGGIGLLRFDGKGNLINIGTTIYTPDKNKPGAVVASSLPSVPATYTVQSNGIGVIKGFVGLPEDLDPPTIFIITRAQCGIAQELFIVLGAVGQDGGLVTLPAKRQRQGTLKCNPSDF